MNNPKFKVGDPIIFHNWLGVIKSIGQEYNSYTNATFNLYVVDWIVSGDNKQDIYPQDYAYHERDIERWHGKYRDRMEIHAIMQFLNGDKNGNKKMY